MAKKEYSSYRQGIISNYYKNLDAIMLNKISELVTDLYLVQTDKKEAQLWDRAYKAMTKLKIPSQIIEHIMEKQNVEILAKNLQDWQKK